MGCCGGKSTTLRVARSSKIVKTVTIKSAAPVVEKSNTTSAKAGRGVRPCRSS